MSARDRYNEFIARHDIAWELTMAGLAILYVAVGFVIDEVPSAGPLLTTSELGLTVVFGLEFSSRLFASRDRRQYLRGHWIDVLALAPPVRELRVLRLLRLLRMVRAFAGMYRALGHVQSLANHRGFAWLIIAWLALMAVCSLGLYAAEHGINKAVDSPFDALWWGVVTLTTVGYGDVVPITPEGRLAAMVLMLLGIGLFSAITATITSFLVTTQPDNTMLTDLQQLATLRESGSLTTEEFAAAKAIILRRHGVGTVPGNQQ